MLSTKLRDSLVKQMNDEFYSSHIYLAMASYCQFENYDGFANFFLVQAEEERTHAMKFYTYLQNRGEHAILAGYEQPETQYESILAAFEKALEHEKTITKQIYDLADIALEEKEHATISFLKWFVDEQVEEEALFDGIISKIRRLANDENSLFLYDVQMSKRSAE